MEGKTKPRVDTKAIKKKMDGYSDRQRAALLKYIAGGCADMVQAMRDVGYSSNSATTMAPILLRREEVREIVSMVTEKALQNALRSSDDILKEITLVGFSDIADYFDVSDTGDMRLKTLAEMGNKSRAIKKMKHTRRDFYAGDGTLLSTENKYEYELHSKMEALTLLGNNKRLFDAKEAGKTDSKELLPRIYLPDNGKGPTKLLIAVEQ
jgi:hypothetical protein